MRWVFPLAIWQYQCIVGALKEDQDENGSNSVGNAGAAYIFALESKLGFSAISDMPVQVYPNPSAGEFWISCSDLNGMGSVNIYDEHGTLVINASPVVLNEEQVYNILSPGIYVLEIIKDGQSHKARIVIYQ